MQLNLEYLKPDFKCKKEKKTQLEKFLHHSSCTFFEFSSSLLLEYGRKTL